MQPVVQQLGHFEGFNFSINSRSSGWQWLPRAKSANLHRLQRNDYADLDTLFGMKKGNGSKKDTLGNIK